MPRTDLNVTAELGDAPAIRRADAATLLSRPPVVQLQPSGWAFPAPAGLSILLAAQAAHITLPSSCRNGTCRSCLCKLEAGRIRYQIEWPGVSQEEREAGYFLPCVSEAETDLVISQNQAFKINVT